MAPNGVTIVLVDDDPGHNELVRRSLRRAGCENPVETIPNGTDALDFVFYRGRFSSRNPQQLVWIVLDINLPGRCDGVEVLRQIKGNAATRRIPVVMFTTTDDPREVDRCYDLGCNVYLAKPADPTEFASTVGFLADLVATVHVASHGPTRSSLP
jgi:CheY-like chemotaxis protein